MISFVKGTHTYSDRDGKVLISVTKLVERYKQPFNTLEVATRCSKKRTSKWYGKPVKEIIRIWDEERKRSTVVGGDYHAIEEQKLLSNPTTEINGRILPVFKPSFDSTGVKVVTDQTLIEGVYPELMVYYKGIAGQSDRVEVIGNRVNIRDYKTSKKLDTSSYVDRFGNSKKMLPPVSHLDDCDYYHYALQGSLYMYFVLESNPGFIPGEISIKHIIFDSQLDQYGFPIAGTSQIKGTDEYHLPYLQKEVMAIIQDYHDNPRNPGKR